ncbi:hypothetical protein HUJ05_010470 [Dendroctonus ponderosae]|nr:hypothetical protein HUJ05_010470 [Dendroctonus ponderosae]
MLIVSENFTVINPSPLLPCANFYEYSCASWRAQTVKPDLEATWNHFTAASYEIKKKIQRILEAPIEDDNLSLHKSQVFYHACLHSKKQEGQHLEELRLLIQHFRGWPILENGYNSSSYSWLEEVASINRKLGFSPIIKFNIGIDYKDTNKYVLYMEPGNLVFPSNLLLDPLESSKELIAYKKWIFESIKLLYPASWIIQNLDDKVRKIVDFERRLAKLMSVKSGMQRNTLGRFTKKLKCDFSKAVEVLYRGMDRKIGKPATVVIKNFKYIKNLVLFMNRVSGGNIANYLIWTIVKEFSRDTSVHLRALNFSIDKAILGIPSDLPQEIECTNKAMEYFSFAILPKYLDWYIKNDTVRSVKMVAEAVKSEYVSLLKANTWLSEKTRELAIDKIQSIQTVIGYSEWMNNGTELQKLYNKLTITGNHFKNILKLKQLIAERNLLLVETSKIVPLWPSNIFDVNAYYSILQNLIFIPLGILQEPFYFENGPRIFSYAALGSLIGHELAHSLDSTGRQADSNGVIRMWWPNEDIIEYQSKSKCFESNANQTESVLLIGETMADNIGLDLSYQAYKTSSNIGLEEILWNFKSDKIFFLSYAQDQWLQVSALEVTSELSLLVIFGQKGHPKFLHSPESC